MRLAPGVACNFPGAILERLKNDDAFRLANFVKGIRGKVEGGGFAGARFVKRLLARGKQLLDQRGQGALFGGKSLSDVFHAEGVPLIGPPILDTI